jgi:hypothetical protein
MAALVNALDNYNPSQIGENGHVEYGWSNSIQEQILAADHHNRFKIVIHLIVIHLKL